MNITVFKYLKGVYTRKGIVYSEAMNKTGSNILVVGFLESPHSPELPHIELNSSEWSFRQTECQRDGDAGGGGGREGHCTWLLGVHPS